MAGSDNGQNCANRGIQIFGGMGIRVIHQWKWLGEIPELRKFMKEPMK